MRRYLLALAAAGLVPVALPAQDSVTYVDRATGKEKTARGTIQGESPAGIRLQAGGAVTEVPALDVRQVTYKFKSDKLTAVDYRRPFGREERALKEARPKERARLLDEALQLFKEVEAQSADVPPARRYLRYKIAEVQARQAQDDPAKVDAAVAALGAYAREFPDGWEVTPCLKLLAKLQEEKGDAAGALATYRDLAKVPGAPAQVQQESTVLVARLLLREHKAAEAEKELKGFKEKMSTTDPQRPYVEVYLAQSELEQGRLAQVEKPLRDALQGTSEAGVRAVAHNLLGDYYLAKKQPEAAFWEYLYVDTLYNQDREEHAKALYHLSTLFDQVKRDPERARQCAEKLQDKQYAGTLYQRRAASEAKSK